MEHPAWKAYVENSQPIPKKRRFSFRPKPLPMDKPLINLVLLILTLITTSLIGGIVYAFGIVGILFAHEMGHYLMCKRYRIPATLPFFIPFPEYSPFGTLGALIQIRGFFPHRRALFDIGIAGPIASFVLSVFALFIGIRIAIDNPAPVFLNYELIFGKSLMFLIIENIATAGSDVGISVLDHPLIFAGWVGLFVTALNLLPIGQLDGGHVVYSMFGKNSKYIYWVMLGAFGITTFFYFGWSLFFVILLLFGRKHPAPIDDFSEINQFRKRLGIAIFIVFFLSFSPVPIEIP
jgi:membrane-associated protease RseP (regulator of RpoE activity)